MSGGLRRNWAELEQGRIECALSDLQPVEIQLVDGEAEYTLWEQLASCIWPRYAPISRSLQGIDIRVWQREC